MSPTDKFISPCSQPEGVERELLVILQEEALEVAHRISKALRFGLEEIQPGQPLTNLQRIFEEMADMEAVTEIMGERGSLSFTDPQLYAGLVLRKKIKVEKYLQSGSISIKEGENA